MNMYLGIRLASVYDRCMDAAFGDKTRVPPARAKSNVFIRLLDVVARMCFALYESRRAKILLSLLLVAAIFSPVLARPDRIANDTVKDAKSSDISIRSAGSWLRVGGKVIHSQTFQNTADFGVVKLRSNYYVAIQSEGSADTLFVLMDTPLTGTDSITVSGQVLLGSGSLQPAVFIEPGMPPNVVLANLIARVGSVLIVVLLGLATLMVLLQRSDFAIDSPVDAPAHVAGAPRFSWYGDLGRHYGDVTVRNMACGFYATVHEARFECTYPKDLWRVSVRRLRSAQVGSVATAFGPMSSARINFEDERGLVRRATLVANTRADLDLVLKVMSVVQ